MVLFSSLIVRDISLVSESEDEGNKSVILARVKYFNENDTEKDDFVFEIMKYFIDNKCSLVSLERIMKLINKEPSITKRYPEDKKTILSMFINYAPEKVITAKAMIMCQSPNCEEYNEVDLHVHKLNCSKCDNELLFKESNFFVYFDLSKQISNYITQNFDKYNFERGSADGKVCDFHDGQISRELYSKLIQKPNRLYLQLTINTDGA